MVNVICVVTTTEHLTIDQVAELMGVSVNTVRGYIRKGRLIRTNSQEGARRALYALSDVLELKAAISAWHEERRGGQSIQNGLKRCSKYREQKPVSAFCKCSTTSSGLMSWCKACTSAQNQLWYQANWERERGKREAYKKAHRDQFRAYRRKAYHKDPHKNYLQHKSWVERNREKSREVNRKWKQGNKERLSRQRKQREAISWGLSGPITKRDGFALVVDRSGDWRAARLDVPFDTGERAVVKLSPPMSRSGKWIVRPWGVLSEDLKPEAQSIVSRCSKARFLVGRERKTAS